MSDGWLPRAGRVAARRSLAAPLFGLLMASVAIPALAQNPPAATGANTSPSGTIQGGASGLQSSQGVSTPPPPAAVSAVPPIPDGSNSLFPDLFGFRQMLTNHGIGLILDTVDEFSGTISGGGGPHTSASSTTGGGSSIAGQVALETDINWETLAGLTGFSTHSIILGRYGGKPASQSIGDNLNPSQEIYGAGGNVVAHLVQVYGEETLAGGALDIQAGIIPLDDNYMASPLYCNYENNSLCGNPKTSTDNIYHSSYPDGVPAFNVRVRPIAQVYVQSGIYFGMDNIYSNKNFRTGFTIDSSYINGEAFPVEIGWEPSFGPNHLPGHYKVGFIYDNNHHTDDYFDANGAPYVLSGLPARVRTGSTSGYVLADQMVYRLGPGANDGVTVLGGYYNNDAETSIRANQFFVGAVATNFWHARPQDTIAFLYTYQNLSGLLGKTQALQLEEGFDPSAGELLANGASGIQTYDEILELNYQIHVFRGVEFAPDFQYFIRPNAQANLPDAAFLGFKTHVTFF